MFDHRWLDPDYARSRDKRSRATRHTHPRWAESDPRRIRRLSGRRAG